jgi:hypothetical protein
VEATLPRLNVQKHLGSCAGTNGAAGKFTKLFNRYYHIPFLKCKIAAAQIGHSASSQDPVPSIYIISILVKVKK